MLVVRWLLEAALLSLCLFFLTRLTRSRAVTSLTIVSFAARVLVGEGLYLISALNVPLLTSLHMPGGFWQLAPDAAGYDLAARQLMGLQDTTGLSPVAATDPFILSVVGMYKVFAVNPSTVLALNAFLAAGCVPLLVFAAGRAGLTRGASLLVAALVGWWPSSFAWSGQMLKDPLQWFGLCVALAGAATLLCSRPGGHWRSYAGAGGLLLVGQFATTSIRGYAAAVFAFAALVGLVVVLVANRTNLRGWLLPSSILVLALLVGSIPARATVLGVSQTLESDLLNQARSIIGSSRVLPEAVRSVLSPSGVSSQAPLPSLPAAVPLSPSPGGCRWLVAIRHGFENTGGASLTDTTVQFQSCLRILAYAPRALELSYLEPTPAQWVQAGNTTGPARYMAALDAVLLWLLLPGLAAGLLHILRRPNGMQTLIVVYMVLSGFALGVAVPNFGTLFRLRLEAILPGTLLAADGWMLIAGTLLPKLKNVPVAPYQEPPRIAPEGDPS